MANLNEHQSFVVPGSVKTSAVGGVEFVVRCCGSHEKSVHIQHPGKHSQEELLRIRDQHLAEIAQEHANHEAAVEFLAQHANNPGERLQATGNREQTSSQTTTSAQTIGDCGCGGT